MKQINIILSSGSPRRQQLLRLLGLPFMVILPVDDVDETPLSDESPAEMVQRLSRLKTQAIISSLNSSSLDLPKLSNQIIIITADTTVALDDHIFGKPKNVADACWMLQKLRQKPHQVYSSLTVGCWQIENGVVNVEPVKLITRLHQNNVQMRSYTDAEIATYIATGDPLDKAGAYGVQHKDFSPVATFEGCFASIMGLPLGELVAILDELGVSRNEIGRACRDYTGHQCCQYL
jgi:MAF protein